MDVEAQKVITELRKAGRHDLAHIYKYEIIAPAEALIKIAQSKRFHKEAFLGQAFVRLFVKWAKKGLEYVGVLRIFYPGLVRTVTKGINTFLDLLSKEFNIKDASIQNTIREITIATKYELEHPSKMKKASLDTSMNEYSTKIPSITMKQAKKLKRFVKISKDQVIDKKTGNLWGISDNGEYIIRFFDANSPDPIKDN